MRVCLIHTRNVSDKKRQQNYPRAVRLQNPPNRLNLDEIPNQIKSVRMKPGRKSC